MRIAIKKIHKRTHHILSYLQHYSFLVYHTLFDRYLARFRAKNDIKHIIHLHCEKKKANICIFAHFDKHNMIDDYVAYHVKELARCDCDIIFVSASRKLPTTQLNKITEYCTKIIIRHNHGKDFGSYKCGINAIDDLSAYQKLIITNDSVYGPLYDLTELLNYGDKQGLDMWGVTDSWERAYHIQSYFMIYNKTIIKSDHFKQFWSQVYNLGCKKNIIYFYEIAGAQYFLKQGYKLGAYCSYLDVKRDLLLGHPAFNEAERKYKEEVKQYCINMSHFMWNVLIKNYQCPFLKRELLHPNPARVEITTWIELINSSTEFNYRLIANHLMRYARFSYINQGRPIL